MNIIAGRLTTGHFTYDKTTSTFIAEMSDLGLSGSVVFGQLFDDACDQGFQMVSERTGHVKPFYLSEVMEQEGEVVGWKFREFKGALKAVILND